MVRQIIGPLWRPSGTRHLSKGIFVDDCSLSSFADFKPMNMAEASAAFAPAVPRASASRPMRVCLVTSSYNYIKDGIALTLNRLVGHLEDKGVEVRIFAPVAGRPALEHRGDLTPVPSVALPMRPEYRLALGLPRRLQADIKEFDPDIIHIAVPDILGYQALRLGQRLKVPVVASYHTRYDTYVQFYAPLKLFQKPVENYLRFFYRNCVQVYVPSDSMADVLREQGFADNLAAWPRGVDVERFHPAKRSQEWRARYGIAPDQVAIVFVGRFVREKGLDLLADTLNELKRRNVAHRSIAVGDGPERAWLEERLPDTIFPGFLHDEDLAQAYASSDIFFFPSQTETFGNVTLEAMASGLPAVCAFATGSRSLVIPRVTGFMAETNSAGDFADHLSTLVADAVARRRMAAVAREGSLNFSWDAAMDRMLGYYRSVLGGTTL
jgi:glycosyltransferase involved in cell wall biosynthesis